MTMSWATGSFHIGVRVPNLEAAMEEYGNALGITWCEKQDREQQVWTPSTGTQTTRLRFVYSCEGPQHIELLQGESGTVWDASPQPGIHHTGVWATDVAAETEALLAKGWTLLACGKAPEDGYGSFSYVVPASGLIVELVADAAEPRFSRWFAGGSLS